VLYVLRLKWICFSVFLNVWCSFVM